MLHSEFWLGKRDLQLFGTTRLRESRKTPPERASARMSTFSAGWDNDGCIQSRLHKTSTSAKHQCLKIQGGKMKHGLRFPCQYLLWILPNQSRDPSASQDVLAKSTGETMGKRMWPLSLLLANRWYLRSGAWGPRGRRKKTNKNNSCRFSLDLHNPFSKPSKLKANSHLG